MQDVRSTLNMPRVGDHADDEPPPELVPTSLLDPEETLPDGDPDPRVERASGDESEDVSARDLLEPFPPFPGAHTELPEPTAVFTATSAGAHGVPGAHRVPGAHGVPDEEEPPFGTASDEHYGRRRPRRRGLGLMVTGGCAGIAIVGFLVLGAGGSKSPAGVAVIDSGSISSTVSPASAPSNGSQANLGTASFASASSSSATSQATSSAPATPTHVASTAPATRSAPSTASSVPTSTPPTGSPTGSQTSPSAKPSKTVCFLGLC